MSGPENDSLLNADLVLRRAFDVATGKLKVDAEVTATISDVDVVIDAAGGDNVAISDGTDILAINADGSINVQTVSDRSDSITTFAGDEAFRLDDTSTANMTYYGYAPAGTSTASSLWKIFRLDETSGIIKQYADGNANYDNIWNNRVGLSYS